MANHNETPRVVDEPCRACRGMGGFARGTGFDACDRCAGAGNRTRYECPAPMLGDVCGMRLICTAVLFDARQTQTYMCLNGHRYTVSYTGSAWQWVRAEDHAALGVGVVAS